MATDSKIDRSESTAERSGCSRTVSFGRVGRKKRVRLPLLPDIDRSAIEWCGPTWNPWQGCIKVSPGCKNCYMYRDKRRYGKDPKKVVRSAAATFDKPLRWQREVEAGRRRGQDRFVFTCSWSDWFIEQADGWRDDAWAIVRRCRGLIFLILTKRVDRIAGNLPSYWDEIKDRCYIGVSVEDQEWADKRRESFRAVPAPVKFVSYEPAVGPVDWTGWEFVQQIISGGESGGIDARFSHPNWHRTTRDFCVPRGIAYFFKQHGEYSYRPVVVERREHVCCIDGAGRDWALSIDESGKISWLAPDESMWSLDHDRLPREDLVEWKRVGKKAAGRLLDGREWSEFPLRQAQGGPEVAS
jgi:protein gp37